jgi:uncharacterized membrane protein
VALFFALGQGRQAQADRSIALSTNIFVQGDGTMASTSYETSVNIEAPADVVYSYVADFPRHVEWNHSPTKITPVTDGPIRVGSQFQTQEQTASNLKLGQRVMLAVMEPVGKLMFGAADYTVAEITALEPNERLAWKSRLPSTKRGDLLRMNWEIQFQSGGNGTNVTQRCEIVPPEESPFARMVNEDMATQGREEATKNLTRLKGIIEGQVA